MNYKTIEKEVERAINRVSLTSEYYYVYENGFEDDLIPAIIKLIGREKIKILKEAESGFLKIFNEETDALKKRYDELVEREVLKARIDELQEYDYLIENSETRIKQLQSQLEKIGERDD